MRFDAEQIEQLEEIKWWDWEISKIITNIELILSTDISAFLDKHIKAPQYI